MARKRKSKPTNSQRSARQKLKDRYAHAREDAQLAGLIPTTPEEALTSEVVDPASQDSQRFPGLDRLAIRNDNGWGVSNEIKRKVVEVNAEVLFEKKVVTKTIEGVDVTIELPPDRQAQAAASKVLMEADKRQWERDCPEAAGKARGSSPINIISSDFWDGLAKQVASANEDEVEKRLAAARVESIERDTSTEEEVK